MNMTRHHRHVVWLAACTLCLQACQQQPAPDNEAATDAATTATAIADRYYTFALANTPELAYFSGVELERHDGLTDNSPAAGEAEHPPDQDWQHEGVFGSFDRAALQRGRRVLRPHRLEHARLHLDARCGGHPSSHPAI